MTGIAVRWRITAGSRCKANSIIRGDVMKTEIGMERPANFKESWPGEYTCFSHFEHAAVVPQVLSLITTLKNNGKPNAAFHAGTVFSGDPSGYYAIMPGISYSHTYDNILRAKEFCINFLSKAYYAACMKTVEENGEDTDEIMAGGFTAEPCKTIGGFRIKEALLSFECKLVSSQDITGQNKLFMFIGQVQLAVVDENCHKLENICGPKGFMYNIPAPQNPLKDERMPTAAAYLTPFVVKEE